MESLPESWQQEDNIFSLSGSCCRSCFQHKCFQHKCSHHKSSQNRCSKHQCSQCHKNSRDVIDHIIAPVFQVPVHKLRLKQRGEASVAFARQVAMYLCHITYGASFTHVGRIFGRDRTTVSHACQLVEEKRDNPTIDWTLDLLELALLQLMKPEITMCACLKTDVGDAVQQREAGHDQKSFA